MPIAAIPNYLGLDFRQASPGMRFGMLLPIWTDREDQEAEVKARAKKKSDEGLEVATMPQRQGMDAAIDRLQRANRNRLPGLWDKNDFAARDAWKTVAKLNPADKQLMKQLAARQAAIADLCNRDGMLRLDALAIAPFTTGLGNEHPLENGFAFLNPYGLPYLPGSGVKGVLRQAARELASGEWGKTPGWSEESANPLMRGAGDARKPVLDEHRQPIMLSKLDVLFGRETADGESEHVRGALTFCDVLPEIAGDALKVEVMTPHQGHYYQQKTDKKTGGIVNPHDSGQPIPIQFLTVPPGSKFRFHVLCDLAHLERLAPELAADARWQALLRAAFAHAFAWLGFGAKTAVGYGAMQLDAEAETAAAEARAEAERQAERNALTPAMREVQDFIDYMQKRHDAMRGGKAKLQGPEHQRARQLADAAHAGADWSAEEKRAVAAAIDEWLPKVVAVEIKEERKKLKLAALRGEG